MSRRLMSLAVAVSLVGLVLTAGPVQAATTLFVNNGVACDDLTVDSTVTPYCGIQAAVDDAVSGDTIMIAAGTYTVSAGPMVVDIFGKNLTLIGSGESTIIDGEDARGGIRVSDDAVLGAASVSVSFLRVTNAAGSGITVQRPNFEGAHLELTSVRVDGNDSSTNGGGILVFNGTTANLQDVIVTGNTAVGSGGGMRIGNSAVVTITDSNFSLNSAGGDGGGLSVLADSTVTITRTIFFDNDAVGAGGGVGIQGSSASVTVVDSTFRQNSAATDEGGGLSFDAGDRLHVFGSVFFDNQSGSSGGGLDDATGPSRDVLIENSTFVQNEALGGTGGGVRTSGELNNVTISQNRAPVGGGLATTGFLDGEPVIRNSILANNIATSSGPECNDVTSAGYNLIEDPTGCIVGGDLTGNVVGEDPGLSDLGDNGGPTLTLAIGSGSAARDAGNPSVPGIGADSCRLDDQRGLLRADARCDIGAFEFGGVPGLVVRYEGANRYATSAAISASDFPVPVDVVFVATGANYPDALAGAAVAGKLGAPMLLVEPTGIPAATAAELTRLSPTTIVILGGTATVSAEVETALGAFGTPVRLAGGNRYATSVEISQYGFPADGSADVVIVASGVGFADALAGGPAGVALNGPVLLTDPNSLPDVVAAEISRLGPSRVVIVGGTAAVSATVSEQIVALGLDVERIAGSSRYETSALISAEAFGGGSSRAYVATGLNFPDALAGAAAAGWLAAPILLVPGTSVPAVVADEITRLGAGIVVVLGGTGVVSGGVETTLEALLGI
jgi:putative cell wall-binding protein